MIRSRWASLASLAAFATVAHADDFKVHLDYTSSHNFLLSNGTSKNLVGPEIGADIKVMSLPLIDFTFSPSVFMGGRLQHGADADGNIYRFMVKGQFTVPVAKIYAFAGVGLSHSQSRANEFQDVNGVEAVVGGGIPIVLGPIPFHPSLEFAIHTAPKGQLAGVSIGLSAGI